MGAFVVLRPDDAGEVALIHAASMRDPWSAASLRQTLANPRVVGLGIEEEGRLVAFGLMMMIGIEAELLTLAVDPAFQRRGLARRLMAGLISRCAERGVGRILLEVAEDNEAARSLYSHEKFEQDGRRTGYYKAGRPQPVDAILMSRTISL